MRGTQCHALTAVGGRPAQEATSTGARGDARPDGKATAPPLVCAKESGNRIRAKRLDTVRIANLVAPGDVSETGASRDDQADSICRHGPIWSRTKHACRLYRTSGSGNV